MTCSDQRKVGMYVATGACSFGRYLSCLVEQSSVAPVPGSPPATPMRGQAGMWAVACVGVGWCAALPGPQVTDTGATHRVTCTLWPTCHLSSATQHRGGGWRSSARCGHTAGCEPTLWAPNPFSEQEWRCGAGHQEAGRQVQPRAEPSLVHFLRPALSSAGAHKDTDLSALGNLHPPPSLSVLLSDQPPRPGSPPGSSVPATE